MNSVEHCWFGRCLFPELFGPEIFTGENAPGVAPSYFLHSWRHVGIAGASPMSHTAFALFHIKGWWLQTVSFERSFFKYELINPPSNDSPFLGEIDLIFMSLRKKLLNSWWFACGSSPSCKIVFPLEDQFRPP